MVAQKAESVAKTKAVLENTAPKKRPVPRVVRDIKAGTTNLNKLNKPELDKIAKRIYAVTQPGKAIPFEQANKNRVVRLIRLGINKM